ncbi:HIT family protein [Candidatus Micrarchaeota archaeon]|nr:HIT family protein [Candidatus Micrarchaeota archaeon]
MSGCIFCKIVRGEVPSIKVYEDQNILAFMDIKPINPGHVLVVPKQHAELLTELEDRFVGEMLIKAKKIGLMLKKSKLNAKGVNYLLADGADAGQEVFHAHLHVIPRYRRDGFEFRMPANYDKETDLADLERIATKIRKAAE